MITITGAHGNFRRFENRYFPQQQWMEIVSESLSMSLPAPVWHLALRALPYEQTGR